MIETRSPHATPAEVASHVKTYHGFMVGLRYVVLAHIVAGVFALTTFFSGGGWFLGIPATIVVLAIGLWFAKDRKQVTAASKLATLLVSTAADEDPPERRYLEPERTRDLTHA
jgi:hypothetical protein